MNDLRFAFRQLRKSPAFTATAVLALAIGIGANSALFSVVNAVLLSPLPFTNPHRLVLVFSTQLESQIPISTSSGPDFLEWRRRARSFEDLAAIQSNRKFSLSGHGEPAALKGALATPSLFPVFGLPMMLGRPFTAEDDTAGGESSLILSHGAWVRQFGGDTNIVGRSVTLNGQPHVHAHFAASTVTGETIATYGGHLEKGAITHVKAAVTIGELEGMEMGKRWVEERKTEDLWLGSMA